MNTSDVKNKLIEDRDLLIQVLESFGFHHITINERRSELRCAYKEEGNDTTVRLSLETMFCQNFATNVKGDIYTLICEQCNQSFQDVHAQLERIINDNSFDFTETRKLFGGFFTKITVDKADDNIYDYSILEKYQNIPNVRFYRDSIGLDVQRKFNVMYDNIQHRIVVPWLSESGVAGTVGRYNGDYDMDGVPKWLALDRFNKSSFLYGMCQNYKDIVSSRKVYVGESEKFVLQLASMGVNTSVAVGSHSISEKQASLLKYLANEVIVCFDEDVEEDVLIKECKKIKVGLFNTTKVGYVFDEHNEVLIKGGKQSPSDLSIEKFNKLTTEFVRYV